MMARSASLLFTAFLLAACESVPRAMSEAPGRAWAASDELLLALAGRFGPAEREARFAQLRPKLARAGLVPSRVFDDATIWTRSEGPLREVQFWGAPGAAGAYRIGIVERAELPGAAGEYRGRLQLERLGQSEFRWQMEDTLALGYVTSEELARAADALLALAEHAPAGDARAAIRESLPRTAAALGRLFSLDRFELQTDKDGARSVVATAGMHPDWLKQGMSGYAAFLRSEIFSMRMSLEVGDAAGTFWTLTMRDGRLELRLRVKGGALAPLEGAPRRLGDACSARFGLTMKQGLFRVGIEKLQSDISLLRGPGPVGFRASFRRQPDWQIPFIVQPFLHDSLRRPFEDEGAMLAYVLRDPGPGSRTTIVARDYRLTVKESWIVRWLGGNVGAVVTDFRRGAEAEADRFVRDALLALRDDVGAMLSETATRP